MLAQRLAELRTCTATGLQLASRLSTLVPVLLADRLPASIGRKLSAALDEAEHQQRRQDAIQTAARIIDAGRELSKHALAGLLRAELERFESVGLRRVVAGHRPPSELEKCLLVILQTDGPQSRDRLAKTLRG